MPLKTLVVRRGLSSQYYFYLSLFANQNDIDLIVDRRLGERRRGVSPRASERRLGDRRREQPASDPDADIVCMIDR